MTDVDPEPEASPLEAVEESSTAAKPGTVTDEAAVPPPRKKRAKKSVKGLQSDWATLKCHEKCHAIMFDPNSGMAAKLFTMFMSTIVIVSIVFFCMGTMPINSTPEKTPTFDTADDVFNIIFTVEFVVRCVLIVAGRPISELTDFFMVVDFLAILPALIDWFSGNAPFSVRVNTADQTLAAIFLLLKSLKSLRLLKLLRFFNEAVILNKALTKSGPALMVPAFAIIITATVFGSFVFVLETIGHAIDHDGEPAAFESIPHTMWFMFVTMTTIGYGDVSPSTDLGKAFTVPVMICGVLLISMPLAVVGNNFTEVWAEKDKVIFVEKLRQLIAAQGLKPNAVQIAFKELDTDNSGTISLKEFKAAIKALQIRMRDGEVLSLWRSIDVDDSGEILVNELVEMIAADGSVEKEEDYNPVFRMNRPKFSTVFVDDESKVHYRAEGDRADLPEGSQMGFKVKWLSGNVNLEDSRGSVTHRSPEPGQYKVLEIDEDEIVYLSPNADGDQFSFDNLSFVFSFEGGDDRVYICNARDHVDNTNADPTGFHVDWKDEQGEPCEAPKAHPVGFEVTGISEDQIVTCKVEATGETRKYTFANPVRNIEFSLPRQNMTVKELEEHMNKRFAKLEEMISKLP